MAEIVTKSRTKKGSHEDLESPRKAKRPGIRMDMTPMVDVAFLLLIFFMVTTVFRRPLAMEINMPEPGASVQVPESNVMTMYVLASDVVLTKTGKGSPEPLAWALIETTLEDAQRSNANLIVLVKVDPDARYGRMVEMMDILDNAKMQRFSLVSMTERDRMALGGWQ
jgi:biopolymer transport protein ExbD